MRRLITCLSVAVLAAGVLATAVRAEEMAEAIPSDLLQGLAQPAILLMQQQLPNPPLKVDPQADKITGYHVKQMVGVVVMPDKSFTAKSLDQPSEKAVPVAIIASKSLSVVQGDKVVGADQLAVVDFMGSAKLPVFYLGVTGKDADRTLEVYSKDGKPLMSVPLKKQAEDAGAPVVVKLAHIDMDKKTLDLVVSLGAYQGIVKMGFIEL